jgi:hypothetical protein
MPDLVEKPTIIAAAGNLPKRIAEYVGRVNSSTAGCEHRAHGGSGGLDRTRAGPGLDEYTVIWRGHGDRECPDSGNGRRPAYGLGRGTGPGAAVVLSGDLWARGGLERGVREIPVTAWN